jgi:hypothetical protein
MRCWSSACEETSIATGALASASARLPVQRDHIGVVSAPPATSAETGSERAEIALRRARREAEAREPRGRLAIQPVTPATVSRDEGMS